jgi:hypothetical protein
VTIIRPAQTGWAPERAASSSPSLFPAGTRPSAAEIPELPETPCTARPAAEEAITLEQYRQFRIHTLTQRQARLRQQPAAPDPPIRTVRSTLRKVRCGGRISGNSISRRRRGPITPKPEARPGNRRPRSPRSVNPVEKFYWSLSRCVRPRLLRRPLSCGGVPPPEPTNRPVIAALLPPATIPCRRCKGCPHRSSVARPIFAEVEVWALGICRGLHRKPSSFDELIFRCNRGRTRHATFSSRLGVGAPRQPSRKMLALYRKYRYKVS